MKIEIAIAGTRDALMQLCRELDSTSSGMAYSRRGMHGPEPEVVLLENEKSVDDTLYTV